MKNAINKELSDVKKAVINSTIEYLKKEIT